MSDDHMQASRDEEKRGAVAVVEESLSLLKATGGLPGRWQRHHLAHAIDSVERGLFGLAHTCARLAALRDGYSERSVQPEPIIDNWQMDDFDKWLAVVKQTPAPLHPLFGPRR